MERDAEEEGARTENEGWVDEEAGDDKRKLQGEMADAKEKEREIERNLSDAQKKGNEAKMKENELRKEEERFDQREKAMKRAGKDIEAETADFESEFSKPAVFRFNRLHRHNHPHSSISYHWTDTSQISLPHASHI